MGLDMFLTVSKYHDRREDFTTDKVNQKYVHLIKQSDLQDFENDHTYGISTEMVAMYWRKANAIHNWFIQNLAGGEDDCRPVYVPKGALEELLKVCKDVNSVHTEEYAKEHLPPSEGFFFGSQDIDEWYWKDLEYTITELTKVLDIVKDSNAFRFQYEASW